MTEAAGTGSARADYRVDKAEALRYLGYAGQRIDEDLDGRIDRLIAECEAKSSPGFVFRAFPVRPEEGRVALEGSTIVLEGRDVRRHLDGARECAVLACTLGLANEMLLARKKAQDPLDALIFSAAGSSLVECVADAAEAAVVADAAARGLHANRRYSPGYGDLPLTCQPAIVSALGADRRLGVTVTESNLLIPAKTVTAVLGLFERVEDRPDVRRSCSGCACAAHCALRAAGTPCHA